MLRVHFLNVGHGDCTIIKHHSGRLTMIDANNSQDFDPETFAEELEEERKKQRNALSGGFSGGGLGGLGGFGGSGGSLLGGLAGSGGFGILSEYAAVADRAKRELTDPIEFLKRTYPNETLWRFVLTHPDLDHMRGLKALLRASDLPIFGTPITPRLSRISEATQTSMIGISTSGFDPPTAR